ncbi:hypothetical protein IM043_gp233 [Bacillus phage SPG24]|nr:hypothetical protein IM043_gp233 [Bacillus phage SPG24]
MVFSLKPYPSFMVITGGQAFS